MTNQSEVTESFPTQVDPESLRLCGKLLEQVSRHIRDGHFFVEWDHGKGWYFDESDVDKNIFMLYDQIVILIEDSVKAKNKTDKKGKLIVHKQMIEYILINKKVRCTTKVHYFDPHNEICDCKQAKRRNQ